MIHKGELILKYHGERYAQHEVKLPITCQFDAQGGIELNFNFEFPESTSKEMVVCNAHGSINENSILQPYGLEFIVPNQQLFFVHFMMVEELEEDEAEMFTGVALFQTEFTADKSLVLHYTF